MKFFQGKSMVWKIQVASCVKVPEFDLARPSQYAAERTGTSGSLHHFPNSKLLSAQLFLNLLPKET